MVLQSTNIADTTSVTSVVTMKYIVIIYAYEFSVYFRSQIISTITMLIKCNIYSRLVLVYEVFFKQTYSVVCVPKIWSSVKSFDNCTEFNSTSELSQPSESTYRLHSNIIHSAITVRWIWFDFNWFVLQRCTGTETGAKILLCGWSHWAQAKMRIKANFNMSSSLQITYFPLVWIDVGKLISQSSNIDPQKLV